MEHNVNDNIPADLKDRAAVVVRQK